MKNIENFINILESFQSEGVDFIIVGGIAVILHGFPRFSEDVDIIVKMTEDNISSIRKALKKLYSDDEINEITLDELKSYSVLRYISPNEDIIDIIGNLGETFSFENINYDLIEFEGRKLKIATVESLIKMKSNTYREKDKMDLNFLKNKLIK